VATCTWFVEEGGAAEAELVAVVAGVVEAGPGVCEGEMVVGVVGVDLVAWSPRARILSLTFEGSG
jgi:hypothetical protein